MSPARGEGRRGCGLAEHHVTSTLTLLGLTDDLVCA